MLRGKKDMMPDFQVDRFQVDIHPGGLSPKKTEPSVSRIQSWQNQ